MKDFEQLIKDSTYGTILVKMPIDLYDTTIVVMKHGDTYDINRYFTIGKNWHVSYDLRNLTEEEVWKEIGIYVTDAVKN